MAESGKRNIEAVDGGNGAEGQEESVKIKKTICSDSGDGNVSACEFLLSGFETKAVLRDSAREKNIFIHGKIADQETVVILEKTPIREENLFELFKNSRLKLEMKNDIYSTYQLHPPPHLNVLMQESAPFPRVIFNVEKQEEKMKILQTAAVEQVNIMTS